MFSPDDDEIVVARGYIREGALWDESVGVL